MWCEFTTEIPERAMANQTTFADFVIPDTVTHIGKEAFMDSHRIKRVYIPKSVVTIERDAFKGCENVEIFCEGEPKEGWVCGMGKEIVRYTTVTPEDDAFNFHRSGGSFSSTTIEREEVRYRNWNPDGRPVHTNVPRNVCDGWDLFRVKYLIVIYQPEHPSYEMVKKAIGELLHEYREFQGIHVISWVDATESNGYAERLGYKNLPSVFDNDKRVTLYEAEPGLTYDEIKGGMESAFRKAIGE